MHGLINGHTANQSFLRSALLITACVVVVALVLLPIAVRQTGSGAPLGLAAAAGICLVSAYLAEGASVALARTGAHLAAMLLSMAIRFTPPLVVCLMLALRGARGREHLAFISYLLVIYLVTLATETWLAVRRASENQPTTRNSR